MTIRQKHTALRKCSFSFIIITLLISGAYGCSPASRPRFRPRIVIKFVEGAGIRLENQQFVLNTPGGKDMLRLKAAGLDAQTAASQLNQLNGLTQNEFVVRIAPLFSDVATSRGTRTNEKLGKRKREQNDVGFALYYSLILKDETPRQELTKLVDQVSRLSIVQTAYEAPTGEDPSMEIPQ